MIFLERGFWLGLNVKLILFLVEYGIWVCVYDFYFYDLWWVIDGFVLFFIGDFFVIEIKIVILKVSILGIRMGEVDIF